MTCRVVLAPPDFIALPEERSWFDWLVSPSVFEDASTEVPDFIAEREKRYYQRKAQRQRYRREARERRQRAIRSFRLEWRTTFDPYRPREQQLFVRTLTGKTHTVCFSAAEDTGFDLIVLIARISGDKDPDYRLIFAGKQLDRSRRVSEYHLTDKSTLHLVLRLRGD